MLSREVRQTAKVAAIEEEIERRAAPPALRSVEHRVTREAGGLTQVRITVKLDPASRGVQGGSTLPL